MRELLQNFEITLIAPTIVYEDNNGAMIWEKEGVRNAEQVSIRVNYVKEQEKQKRIFLKHCSTEMMLACLFTNPLMRIRFRRLRDAIGVMNIQGI